MSPLDVVGKTISWKPTPKDSFRFYGEVIKVYYETGSDPRYPKGSQGYKNGIRKLFRKMKVIINDGRILTISGEHEDLKRMSAMPDVVN